MMEQFVFDIIGKRVPTKLSGKIRKDGKHYLAISFVGASTLVSLNKVAGEVYLRCDGKKTISDIVKELSELYPNVQLNILNKDVARCVRDLEVMRLITVVTQESESNAVCN
ncbi:MAG: PqqD family protein [Firmicutes bacterium]|nr:PqqD family protein [Bacillota bacterium]